MPSEREAIRKLLRENPELHRALQKAILEGRLHDASAIDSEEEIIIAVGPNHGGVEGAKQVKCECGELGWLSPSSQALMTERGRYPTRVMCMSCILRESNAQKG
jgi:hypothetical protein